MAAPDRQAFRAERDRVYEMPAAEEREARFEGLHGRWFVRLGPDGPLHAEPPAHAAILRFEARALRRGRLWATMPAWSWNDTWPGGARVRGKRSGAHAKRPTRRATRRRKSSACWRLAARRASG